MNSNNKTENQDTKILIVEDSPTQATQLTYFLEENGYQFFHATDGEEAFASAHEIRPDLIISDVLMPKMNGYEICQAIKQDETLKYIPVILLTLLAEPNDVVLGLNSGADCYIIKPYDKNYLLGTVDNVLKTPIIEKSSEESGNLSVTIAGEQHAITSSPQQILSLSFSIYQNAIYQNDLLIKAKDEIEELNKNLEDRVNERTSELTRSFTGTTKAISDLAESRDPYTAGHARNVTHLSIRIAEKMNVSQGEIQGLEVCALLHDVGKVVTPSAILNKPGRLTNHEFGIIKLHPTTAYETLKNIPFPWPVAEVVYQHHERMDGSGYPRGLKGDEIHPWARILVVADVVDAMISHRPYRPALPKKVAFEEIERGRETSYDPQVVDACLAVLGESARRVLVVDDNPEVTEILMRFLHEMGIEGDGFNDPGLALEAFKEEPYSLVITDLNMPDMSGFEVLENVKQIHPASKVIVITGYGDKESVVEALRLGADDFLEKPVRLKSFCSAVDKSIKHYQNGE